MKNEIDVGHFRLSVDATRNEDSVKNMFDNIFFTRLFASERRQITVMAEVKSPTRISLRHFATKSLRNEENMIEKIKALWIKYEEIIAYLIVGGLTTVVSWAAKFLANFLLFDNTMYPTPFQNVVLSIINWTAGVIFAYFTNRKFVFKSNAPMLSEAPKFVLSRVSTLILDMVVMQVLTAIGVNLLVATLISAVLVIIGNYVFSKLFVFNKKKDGEAEEK